MGPGLPLALASLAACRTAEVAPPSAGSHGSTPTAAVPPNVLVILADDLGTDKVAAYGEHPSPPATPNIDALAAQGVLFRNAWAYDSCSPTRAALLTGRYGRRTGVGEVIDAYEGSYELPLDEILIPEMLARSAQRWDTSAVGKWHLATWNSADNIFHPGRQGFAWYATVVSNLDQSANQDYIESYFDWVKVDNGVLTWQTTYATTDQVDDAVARVGAMKPPWFLYLALNAPHTPLTLPPDALWPSGELALPGTLAERYQAVVEAMDTELGRLLASVDLSTTTVVFLGDNGTPDFAVLPPLDPASSKLSLFEGGINVPLIVAGPQIAKPGSECEALVHAVDVFATVADVAGVDLADLRDDAGQPVAIDGQSLLPFLADPSATGRQFVYTEEFHPNGPRARTDDERAVRDARYKLWIGELSGIEAFFDLQGRNDDGPELLSQGPLSPDAQAGYDLLESAMDDFRASLPQDE